MMLGVDRLANLVADLIESLLFGGMVLFLALVCLLVLFSIGWGVLWWWTK